MSFNIPELENVSGLTSQEYVYARLRNAIMVGAIPTGTSLTMRGLAQLMDLSPTPIREALRRLNSESAVELKDNRRLIIPKMTIGRFEDLVATRVALESHAAERALPYVSDILIEEMSEIDFEMDKAIPNLDYDRLTSLNQAFHRKLYCANPNHSAMPLIESVWLQLGPFHREMITDVGKFYLVDHHKTILAALSDRDAVALVLALKQDIKDGVLLEGRAMIALRAEDKLKSALEEFTRK
ncbi:GntR family transcriptional regulator [Actibacterium pelagium]|uniref:Transcriptional regulator n=1 Tax=Actibacterium pelagium TaxID=2029103 RepID=A0A917EKM5_9RHOB|nr:GntR family transcriptional regulator [Actibacterium pelagium]GGE48315.1 transcriptional regulator [Actibacterium pelagium]